MRVGPAVQPRAEDILTGQPPSDDGQTLRDLARILWALPILVAFPGLFWFLFFFDGVEAARSANDRTASFGWFIVASAVATWFGSVVSTGYVWAVGSRIGRARGYAILWPPFGRRLRKLDPGAVGALPTYRPGWVEESTLRAFVVFSTVGMAGISLSMIVPEAAHGGFSVLQIGLEAIGFGTFVAGFPIMFVGKNCANLLKTPYPA